MSQFDPIPQPPAPPDPVVVAQWAGQIRGLIILLGGIGIGGAWLQKITDAQLTNDVTAVLTVAGVAAWAASSAWSWWQKRKAAKAARTAAVASAVASAHATFKNNAPTPLTVEPSPIVGLAPIATHVSLMDAATVPLPDLNIPAQPPPKDASS